MRRLTLKRPRFFKGLNAPYRMVFINEETLDEVGSFHLTKRSVYTLFSTLFVVTILVTVFILLFSPLRYYIPGYGSNVARVQVLQLQQRVDSLGDLVQAQTAHAADIRRVIAGTDHGERDTAMLKPELMREDAEAGILPRSSEIQQQAGAMLPKKTRRSR